MAIFDFTDYKAFLKSRLEHGSQRRLAAFVRCQPAFLSQVLRGKPHFSLEQGILATEYFQLDNAEQEYFMLALQFGRSGSTKLRTYFADRMQLLRARHQRVDNKIGKFEKLDDLSKHTFYSSWKFAAVHVLLSIPCSNQYELIKSKTGLSDREIEKTIDFLKDTGLIERQNGKWRPTKKRIHLSPEDTLIGTHHKNFRALSLAKLEELKPDSLHFSSIFALSGSDCTKIKNLILELISKAELILKPSDEQEVRVFCIDFFDPGESPR